MTLIEAVSPTARRLLKKTTFDGAISYALHWQKNQWRQFLLAETDDDKLLALECRLHSVSDDVRLLRGCDEEKDREQSATNLRFSLANLVAFLLLWLSAGQGDQSGAVAAVRAERERQKRLHREQPGKYLVDVAHPTPDNRRKFRVLFEEAGEVAKAIDQLEIASRAERKFAAHDLQTEITQTTAVAVAWLESIEPEINQIQNSKLKTQH